MCEDLVRAEVLSTQLWDLGSGDGPGKGLTVLLCLVKLALLIPPFLGTGCQLPRATMPVTTVLNWTSAAPQLSRRVPRASWLAA